MLVIMIVIETYMIISHIQLAVKAPTNVYGRSECYWRNSYVDLLWSLFSSNSKYLFAVSHI